ncbi:MAG: hypothetical protein DRR06_12055 [Gammaproteobacteria bacterium]|nr:MAG: hypothetical protein DRR06_12055 [Gammaproteobacteria bacterium]
MCLVTLAFQSHPNYPLIVVANRDEYYDRPAAQAIFWSDHPDLLAGRDLEAGGTWFGVNRAGHWATVTNFRGGGLAADLSRGELPTNYLRNGSPRVKQYFGQILDQGDRYNGFNLLAGTVNELAYCNNLNNEMSLLSPGVYTLSNDLLDTPWPKAELAREKLQQAITQNVLRSEELVEVLASRQCFPDGHLPDTGVGIEMERTLSPPFIVAHSYGTRCTTVLLIGKQGNVEFAEQTFLRGRPVGDIRQYRFTAQG